MVQKELVLFNYKNNRTNEGTLWASNRYGAQGYVSDQRWALSEAQVACQQLGFTLGAIGFTAGSLFRKAEKHYTEYESMFAVQCQGNESHIQDCSYSARGSGVSIYRYHRGYSAGVICNGKFYPLRGLLPDTPIWQKKCLKI